MVPSPHPALALKQHFLPDFKRFMQHGEGLAFGLTTPNWKQWTPDHAFESAKLLLTQQPLQRATEFASGWYTSNSALNVSLGFCFWTSVVCWFLQEVTGNYSQVDRVWTVLPVLYSAHFTFYNHFASHGLSKKLFSWTGSRGSSWQQAFVPDGVDPRMFLVFLLQLLWGLRLSGNTLRRGLYSFTEEDYRWPILRKAMPKWQYKLLSFFFIAFAQNVLMWIIAAPQYLLLTARAVEHPSRAPPALGLPDFLLAGAYIGILLIEQIADEQQQAYQSWKRKPDATSTAGKNGEQIVMDRAKVNRGFRTDGLFAWSRHPNFACEVAHWYILYLFTLRATVPSTVYTDLFTGLQKVADQAIGQQHFNTILLKTIFKQAAPHLINYSIIGPISMTLLFYASTPFTEQITAKKYPLYKDYKKRVGMLWPADTVLKIVLLGVTGRLKRLNSRVFGSAALEDKPKKK